MPAAGVKTWIQVDKAQTVAVNNSDFPIQQHRFVQGGPPSTTSSQLEKTDEELLLSLRQKLTTRGVRGINGIRRVFKIMDDNQSKTLDFGEFAKAMQDYRISTDQGEIQRIFALFDRDGCGTINYDDFLRAIVGEMNDRRKSQVLLAFAKFDRDGSGVINIEDLKGVYNAR